MPTIYLGLIVHFVLSDGTHRPAMICNIYEDNNIVDLWVHDDPANMGMFWQPCVIRYDEPTPYTWHFIEQ